MKEKNSKHEEKGSKNKMKNEKENSLENIYHEIIDDLKLKNKRLGSIDELILEYPEIYDEIKKLEKKKDLFLGLSFEEYLRGLGLLTDKKSLNEIANGESNKINIETYFVEEIDIPKDEVDDWKTIEKKGKLYLYDYIGNKKSIILPVSLDGKKIDGIHYGAFDNCNSEKIEIPGYFKNIPMIGFDNYSIKSITFGEGVKIIQDIGSMPNIEELKVSKSVDKYEDDYYNLKSTKWYKKQGEFAVLGKILIRYKGSNNVMRVPSGIEVINKDVAQKLKKVIFSNSVHTISDYAFYHNNQNLEEFIIPPSVKNIGLKALGDNKWTKNYNKKPIIINGILYKHETNKKEIKIPYGITQIGPKVFENRKKIEKIILPDTLKIIRKGAFSVCTRLSEIDIPKKLLIIEERSFEFCRNLNNLVLPDKVKEIGSYAFNECEKLTSVIISDSCKTIHEGAFSGCRKLENIELNYGLNSIGANVFEGCSSLEQINIPETVNNLGSRIFYRCIRLKNINIPNGIEVIEDGMFGKCSELKRIDLPISIKEIGDYAFSDCSELYYIKLPPIIGSDSFRNCDKLEKVDLSKSTIEIPRGAFENCTSIFEIVIPESVKKIGSEAFKGCENLDDVKLSENIEEIGDSAFENCYSLENINIPANIKKVGVGVFNNTIYARDKGNEFDIKNNVLYKYLGGKTLVTIPADVKKIAKNSFKESNFLEELIISDSVETIEDYAFYGCEKIEKIEFGKELTYIGSKAFSNTMINKSNFPKNIKRIGENAFYFCRELIIKDDTEADKARYCVKWNPKYITVTSADTNKTKFSIYCVDKEKGKYRSLIISELGEESNFKFNDYDELFLRVSELKEKDKIAFSRIQFPYKLDENYKDIYIDYLIETLSSENTTKRIAELITKEDDVEKIMILNQNDLINESNKNWIHEIINKNAADKCKNYLMNIK
jgi:hypothetical protein